MSLYFFGDSWSAEFGELEAWHVKNKIEPSEPLRSYPAMVSEILEMPYKNFSISGSSQLNMVQQLLNSDATQGDHAIFSLTASSRRFYYSEENKIVHLSIDETKGAVSVHQDSWLSALACFTLYSYCVQNGIHPWFVNTFEVSYHNRISEHHSLWNSIPDNVWLIPKHTCLVETEFDPNWYADGVKNLSANIYNWLTSGRDTVEEFIRPCSDHPNLNGRKKIAKKIATELKNKIKEIDNVSI